MAEHSNYKFKPLLNTDVVTVPGRLQLHTKEGRESYLSRIKVRTLLARAYPLLTVKSVKSLAAGQPEHENCARTRACIASQEAETDIAQAVEERRTQQERDELNECTFKPEVCSLQPQHSRLPRRLPPTTARCRGSDHACVQIRDAPQYVKRIANSMKLTRAAKPPPEKTNYSFLSTREH